jgi:hypothetical protein
MRSTLQTYHMPQVMELSPHHSVDGGFQLMKIGMVYCDKCLIDFNHFPVSYLSALGTLFILFRGGT